LRLAGPGDLVAAITLCPRQKSADGCGERGISGVVPAAHPVTCSRGAGSADVTWRPDSKVRCRTCSTG